MTAAALLAYVNATQDDLGFVTECFDEATALVDGRIGAATVPVSVKARAIKEVGAELFHRRTTKNGVAQFAAGDGAPVRVARDPMVAAYPLLAPYLGLGAA